LFWHLAQPVTILGKEIRAGRLNRALAAGSQPPGNFDARLYVKAKACAFSECLSRFFLKRKMNKPEGHGLSSKHFQAKYLCLKIV